MSDAHPSACICVECQDRRSGTDRRAVDHPAHYRPGTYEAINVIEAWGLGFCLGNAVKYICRAGLKSESAVEDLKKARWYIERELARIEGPGT